jgi:FkbM family methyltransferase
VALTRRTFRNWVPAGVLVSMGDTAVAPSISARRGVARRRFAFRTRMGPVLETEVGNSAPILEVFAKDGYAADIDWPEVRSILDLGAHVGSFVCWAAVMAPQAHFVAVEPDPDNARALTANVRRNGLEPRVRIREVAVGEDEGTRSLSGMPGSNRYASSIVVDRGGPRVDVKTTTLSRLLDDELSGPIDVLKMDVEGAEWEILEATGGEVWSRVRHLLLECHLRPDQTMADLEGLLARRGFETIAMDDVGSLHEGPFRYQSRVHARRADPDHPAAR